MVEQLFGEVLRIHAIGLPIPYSIGNPDKVELIIDEVLICAALRCKLMPGVRMRYTVPSR
jgi:hypothetical protein